MITYVDIFNPERGQNRDFLDHLPPFFVHVVMECPHGQKYFEHCQKYFKYYQNNFELADGLGIRV